MTILPDCTQTSEPCALQQENEVDKDNIPEDGNDNENMQEEEDEDTDFNPFLDDANSLEASSSLSSEVEDLAVDMSLSRGNTSAAFDENSIERCVDVMQTGGTVGQGENLVMQTTVPPGEVCINKSNILSFDREPLLTSQSENEPLCDKDDDLTTAIDVSNAAAGAKKPHLDMDSDGAICMRTRARYSLASFTLDQLETFLQETDDEDDLQNVDDEEEYRKFLAAVLRGDEFFNPQESANVDDEDEENDADFELELEEALESEPEEVEERRMTRRNRRQKASVESSMKLSGLLTRPLRPLLPFASLGAFPAFDGSNHLSTNVGPSYMPPVNNGCTYGFTPHQIGQLHCLIHEHVQLLIQVFSISVLEPLKSHIATQVRELILELLRKREQLLAWRTIPYPSFCFSPPYIHPSVPDEFHKFLPVDSCNKNQEHDIPSGCNRELHSDVSLPNLHTNLTEEQAGSFRATECSSWMPYICGPVQSVIDVAPLRLVENYMDDVSSAVQTHERCQIELGFDTHCQKEPLFPLDSSSCNAESDGHGEVENTPPLSSGMLLASSKNQMPKKTMAATLLEKAKNQSIALVPKEISELTQRFRPLFNPTLYPHKPPLASLANRVLFTDAEDELLALGLMEYNTDWKAIQQRFLPCKSRHQIFVRQKNRASSKAPENPIKTVRRMKNSPLTSEEIARIELGLKKFKLDWISIWTFFVPYRDPSLLPRQWRIACGTQKSYKSDGNKKAKRRLYELRRKASKPPPSTWHSSSEKEGDSTDNAVEDTNSGDNLIEKEEEAYLHEAFLADWMPENNDSISSPTGLHSGGSQARQQKEYSGSANTQPLASSNAPSRSSYSQIVMRPYRARRPNNARLVKLAPDLPPVNLPPSVRVMSQSAFRNSQAIAATKVPGNALRVGAVGQNLGQQAGGTIRSEVGSSVRSGPSKNNPVNIPASSQKHPNHPNTLNDSCASERVDSELQMHPLLFQPPLDGHLPCYQPNSSTAMSMSNSFTFFSGRQPQLSMSRFHNPRDIRDAVNLLSKSSKTNDKITLSSSVDFHPLLQKTNNVDMNPTGVHPVPARVPSSAKSRKKHVLVESPCESVSKQFLNGGSNASTTKDARNAGKGSDIDLDIHLSSTSANQEAVGSSNMAVPSTGKSSNVPTPVAIESEVARDSSNIRDSAPDGIDNELNSSDFALITSINKGGKEISDDTHHDSLPEIIMEQEELSDSEEEFGENVEFEQEEMADSDGEGTSDSQPFVNIPNEEVHQDEMDVDTDNSQVANANKCRGRTCSKSDGQSISNGIEASAEVANIQLNAESSNMNSCPQDPHTNLKKPMVGYEFGPFGTPGTIGLNKLPTSSKRSSRHSKVTTGKTPLKQSEDPPERQNPGSAGATLPRNLRKRGSRSNSNSSTSSPNTSMDVKHFKSARTD